MSDKYATHFHELIDPVELTKFPERFTYDYDTGCYLRKQSPEWMEWFSRERAKAAAQREADTFFVHELETLRAQARSEGYDPDTRPEEFLHWLRSDVKYEKTGDMERLDPDNVNSPLVPTLRGVSRLQQASRAADAVAEAMTTETSDRSVKGLSYRDAIEVKAAPSGTLSGYLAVFGNVDATGDIIEKGAFKATIAAAKANGRAYLVPLLLQHDTAKPIGGITDLSEDIHGLRFQGKLDLNTQAGREAYSGIKDGYLTGMSIGYKTLEEGWQGSNRLLKAIHLYEGSVCTFPANDQARITMAE